MSQELETLLIIKGQIASMPPTQQAMVKNAENLIRQILVSHHSYCILAIALVGAELAEQAG